MKKWLTWLFTLSLGLTLLLAGCTLTEKKEITGEPLDFTVVPAEDVPDELKTILEANKESEMMISYRSAIIFTSFAVTGSRRPGAAASPWIS